MNETSDGEPIDLWCSFTEEIADPYLLHEYGALLDGAEQVQRRKFHFARDQHRYLVTRALVRTVLSRYADVPPNDWIFRQNAYGRPEIANNSARALGLHFNISHTNGLVLVAVTRSRDLGVDVENTTRAAALDLADRYFAPAESSSLRQLHPQLQQQRFFEYWTLKESYTKARGMGLLIPLNRFSFDLASTPNDRLSFSIDPHENDSPARWQFWQLRVRHEFLVAVCAERIASEHLYLSARKIIPLVTEGPLTFETVRSSAGAAARRPIGIQPLNQDEMRGSMSVRAACLVPGAYLPVTAG